MEDFSIVETPKGPRAFAYQHYFPPTFSRGKIELTCWKNNLQPSQGGLGSFRHLMNSYIELYPDLAPSICEWTVDRFRTFDTDLQRVYQDRSAYSCISLAGGANTAKSFSGALYALMFYYANPTERTVIVSSTTLDLLKLRIWKDISSFHLEEYGGKIRDNTSKGSPSIRFDPNNAHGIYARPLESKANSTDTILKNLIGIKAKDALLMIIDEADSIDPAIKSAFENLRRNVFQVIVIANSNKKTDFHGILSEPKDGWPSVHPDTHSSWRTKNGICLYFDCYQSPAIKHPEKAMVKSDPLSHYITVSSLEKIRTELGADSRAFWRFYRGFWAPDDSDETILTHSMLAHYKLTSKAVWNGNQPLTKLAALDPAFGGSDRCVLVVGTVGLCSDGIIRLQVGDFYIFRVSAESPIPTSNQILKLTKEKLKELKIPYANFAIDCTGIGLGTSDLLYTELSADIHQVFFSGSASDYLVKGNLRASDIYDRKASELLFAIKEIAEQDLLRGLPQEASKELINRLWEYKRKKLAAETKQEYKQRYGESPDYSDAVSILVDLAKHRFLPLNQSAVVNSNNPLLSKFEPEEFAVSEFEDNEAFLNFMKNW